MQNPQPSGLQPNETAVTLDTGDLVAVAASCSVEETSGDPVLTATARVINADGTDKLDVNGQATLKSAFSHKTCQPEIDAAGGMANVQKCVLMAVLGEPTAPLWQDPICATMLANASIRSNLYAAQHAGPVNTWSLL